jgi:hypothetical protein
MANALMVSQVADVPPSKLVDRTGYQASDGYEQVAIPFWDQEPQVDNVGDSPTWAASEPVFSPQIWDNLTLGDIAMPGKWRLSGSCSQDMDVQKPQGFDGGALVLRGYVAAIVTMEGTLWTPQQWKMFQTIIPKIWRRANKISGQSVMIGTKGQVKQAQTASYAQTVAALQQAGFTLTQAKAQATANATLQAESASAAGNTPVGKQQTTNDGLIVGKEWALGISHPATQLFGITSIVITRPYLPEPGSIVGTMTVKFDAREYVPEPDIVPTAQRVAKGATTQKQRARNTLAKKADPSGLANAAAPGTVPTSLP